MKFHTPYNIEDPLKHSDATGLRCKDPTLAQQQFKDESDINVLFGKYLETGEIPQIDNLRNWGDTEGLYDFQETMNALVAAQQDFSQLPARVKNRFDNDPAKLITFLNDPENRDEAEFLGLVNKRQDQQPGGSTLSSGEPSQPQPTPSGPTSGSPATRTPGTATPPAAAQ